MKIEQVPPTEPQFTLTLGFAEMLALSAITGYVGGEPTGPRGVFSELSTKLQDMGFPWYKLALRELNSTIAPCRHCGKGSGGIRFEEAE